MENQTISPPSGRHLENVEATITGWSRRHLQH